MWKKSAHASSMEEPIFLDAFRQTKEREGEAVSRVCLSCHAPAVEVTKDWDLEQKLSWEGVGCDICHSISAVKAVGSTAKFELDAGVVKRGPIRNASSMAHDVLFSELHTQSLVCGPCHEFSNSEGVPLMTTFSEWKASSAARQNKTCQQCHMGETKANVVDPVIKRLPEAKVNLHEVPGGHSLSQLIKGVEVVLRPQRDAGALLLDVRLRNRGAGHAIPTGMPGREINLSVKVRTSEGGSFDERRSYRKTYVGAGGGEITRDSSYFARGVKFVSDTRIQADESRTERFRFAVPEHATAYLSVKLHYEHAPTGRDQNRTFITFFSEERTLLPEQPHNQ
jgi:hypothetical protein